jgi:membrane-bound lytic murein transglycosylase D
MSVPKNKKRKQLPMRFSVIVVLTVVGLTGCNALQTRPDHVSTASATAAAPASPAPAAAAGAQAASPDADAGQPGPSAAPAPQTAAASNGQSTAPVTSATPDLASAAPAPRAEPPQPAAPPPPRTIWQRLRRGFRLPDYDNPRVRTQLQWYASHQEYLKRVMDRAEPFLYMIAQEVEKRRMPSEIALLPVVESAFQPFAYSHGRAAGIWQFIPSTGRLYGLKQNWWYDGRRDVVASTDAALDYLDKLDKQFNGDWLLALAAYNSGEGTVASAVARNRRKHIPTDFWYLSLPRETESYAPKLLAIAAIIKNPQKYGIHLKPIPNKPQVALVDVGSQIDLALAANMAGISIEEMYRLNPGFNRWATDPRGPYRLLVPIDKKERFEEKLASLPKHKRIEWKRHRIRSGESLIAIARHYHTTPAMLRRVNRLRGNRIVAGHHLIIPVARRAFASYELSALQRRKALRRARGGHKTIHVVRRGDTFWDLSRRYKVPVRKLAKWNGMSPKDYLKPGEKLVIWGRAHVQPAVYHPPARGSAPLAAMVRPIRYVVRTGDSLARIARRFSVSVAQLCKWNRLDAGNYLQPGQHLTLYVDVTAQADSS